ncbi:MAG: bifunctional 5,10-methylene-tetrahydrofolate dehydrogenase/5,10-methylene-tetrahydrofolate cyclohydrolase [Flavobacteriales bacterium]|nr:bifunctional 5,10-methylene-tetrahydrofolate dehydrogenase/5,10-methylene-tetrahydrofolate cyclohydrolase [Flavobacteriales bacterium]
MQIIDGKRVSEKLKEKIKQETVSWIHKGGKKPHLCAILVGNDGASHTYVAAKMKDCESIGFTSSIYRFDETITEEELLKTIREINANPDIDGLIVQLPLPKHISVDKVTQTISPEKDVDGFHPQNVGRLSIGLPTYISATPYGIMQLFDYYNIDTVGKHCVVLGRSNIVGTPVSILMSRNTTPGNATVTLCHSKTQNLENYTRNADIIIAAIGIPEFVKAHMIKPGAVVIDVGITRIKDPSKKSGYRLVGDVAYDEVAPLCSYITPVPGGVGPMTRIGLLMNTLKSARKEIYSGKI